MEMIPFRATIEIIGVNPFVFLPEHVLNELFKQSGKSTGKIPVTMTIDGHAFTQTLVKWQAAWRLYLNTPMRRAACKEVGDVADFAISYNPSKREVPIHPRFALALQEHAQAKKVFESLPPSRQQEINRYFAALKTEATVERNLQRAIQFLLGHGRFIGRDKP